MWGSRIWGKSGLSFKASGHLDSFEPLNLFKICSIALFLQAFHHSRPLPQTDRMCPFPLRSSGLRTYPGVFSSPPFQGPGDVGALALGHVASLGMHSCSLSPQLQFTPEQNENLGSLEEGELLFAVQVTCQVGRRKTSHEMAGGQRWLPVTTVLVA